RAKLDSPATIGEVEVRRQRQTLTLRGDLVAFEADRFLDVVKAQRPALDLRSRLAQRDGCDDAKEHRTGCKGCPDEPHRGDPTLERREVRKGRTEKQLSSLL